MGSHGWEAFRQSLSADHTFLKVLGRSLQRKSSTGNNVACCSPQWDLLHGLLLWSHSESNSPLSSITLNHLLSSSSISLSPPKPYGSVLPAASVAYSTADKNSRAQQTKATTRSSMDPFQLPFLLFGLGETPNFIQKLIIGAATPPVVDGGGSSADLHGGSWQQRVEVGTHKWRNLVPNSQVIVIPNPPTKPKR